MSDLVFKCRRWGAHCTKNCGQRIRNVVRGDKASARTGYPTRSDNSFFE